MSIFPVNEFETRVERARAAMTGERLDALLITSEANFRYFTGFDSQTWISPTRPRYFVLPRASAPVAIVPASNVAGMRAASWVTEVRSWQAPNPEDDGVSLLAAALRDCRGTHGAIGAEIGAESRLGMPVADFLRLQEMVRPLTVRDGGPVFRAVRMIKSPAEIECIRRAARILSDAFAALPGSLHVGMTERQACAELHVDLIGRGMDKVPYLVGVSGADGYDNTNMGPTDRVLSQGDLLFIDVGCTIDGYFCDFDRHISFGLPSSDTRRAFDAVYRATDAGIASIRPGSRACDVWQAMADALSGFDADEANIGRMGHGVGQLITEAPSISREDQTILGPGMVVTVEPATAYANGRGEAKLMVHEENVVVTANGVELLSRRAPPEIVVVN